LMTNPFLFVLFLPLSFAPLVMSSVFCLWIVNGGDVWRLKIVVKVLDWWRWKVVEMDSGFGYWLIVEDDDYVWWCGVYWRWYCCVRFWLWRWLYYDWI
jgi:hypothetical protein